MKSSGNQTTPANHLEPRARPRPTSEMDPELEIMTVSQFLSTISYSAADLRFTPNGEVNSLFRVFRYEIWISGFMHRKSAPVNIIHYK